MSVVVVEELHKRYGDNHADRGLSLTIEVGEVIALVGLTAKADERTKTLSGGPAPEGSSSMGSRWNGAASRTPTSS